jgi:hypothetical protein
MGIDESFIGICLLGRSSLSNIHRNRVPIRIEKSFKCGLREGGRCNLSSGSKNRPSEVQSGTSGLKTTVKIMQLWIYTKLGGCLIYLHARFKLAYLRKIDTRPDNAVRRKWKLLRFHFIGHNRF